jgi:hypothetical protein
VLATGNWLYLHPPLGRSPNALFQEMIDGTAYRPHVTRALVPFLVRAIADFLPPAASEALKRPLVWAGFAPVLLPDTHPELKPIDFYIWVYLTILSLTLLGEGTRRFLESLYQGDAWLFVAGGAVTVAVWPLLACYSSYVYDPFTPTLVVWLFFAGIRQKWAAYYPLLVLGALNKETTVLVPVAVWFALSERSRWQTHLRRAVVDVALATSVHLGLALLVFRANPGGLAEFHLFDHNLSLAAAALTMPPAALIVVVVVGLCLPDWSRKPRPAKALALLAVPLVAFAMFFGYIDELRQYSESLPGFAALAFPTVVSRNGRDPYRPRPGEG